MGNLFGKKHTKPKVTDTDMQILELKQVRDKIQQYIKRVENQMARDRTVAKDLVAKKKLELAKLLLRKKKFLENMHANAQGQLENIERMIETIDLAQLQKEVVEGLKEGNAVLKELQSATKIEDVERMMDETREAMDIQQEISAILSGSTLTSGDEHDVEAEFDKLLSEQMANKLPEVPKHIPEKEPELNLPDVPSHVPQEEEKEEKVMLAA